MKYNIIGQNERCYPSESSPLKGYIEVIVVLVEGTIGDYAAYIGEGRPEWVAAFGNKISFREAREHFPNIIEDKYRS